MQNERFGEVEAASSAKTSANLYDCTMLTATNAAAASLRVAHHVVLLLPLVLMLLPKPMLPMVVPVAAISYHPDPYLQRHRDVSRIRRRLRNSYFYAAATGSSCTIGSRSTLTNTTSCTSNNNNDCINKVSTIGGGILATIGRVIKRNSNVRRYNHLEHHQHQPGARFTFTFPDREMANGMYGPVRPGSHSIRFNHDRVGLTKRTRLSLDGNDCNTILENNAGDVDTNYCWPDSTELLGYASDEDAEAEGWRVLRYRRRVGYGRECYERVKHAVLDWEFAASDDHCEPLPSTTSRK